MSASILGIGASPGRAIGRIRRISLDPPTVPHRTIGPEEVEAELARFEAVRSWAVERTHEVRRRTAERLGEVEAKIFEPQVLMLEDPDLVDGTVAYIRENYLAAERAFEWRLLEIRSRFLDTGHAMVADRLADLRDIRIRVLSRLMEKTSGANDLSAGAEVRTAGRQGLVGAEDLAAGTVGLAGEEASILAFQELTPSFVLRLDPAGIQGIVTASGSRASHSAVLARSLGIPAVVGLGERIGELSDGMTAILDGATGRLTVDPEPEERERFHRALERSTRRRHRLAELAARPSRTVDGVRVRLRVNLDQPDDLEAAIELRPDGVGLLRSEFLVIGRRTVPSEEQQYRAYRRVVESFADREVTLRTFDIGGDKFPIFLQMPAEENPYLGWRAIRVCLDRPELFQNQLRAACRAARHGRLRLLLPLIVSAEEVLRTREHLRRVRQSLGWSEDDPEVPLGVMIETPAAVETLDLLAPHVDFLSLGTNDLTQYTLAVDRDNARLADRYDPLHPSLVRLYRRLVRAAEVHDLPLGVCGELASDPVGLAVLLGLGYREFSVSAASLPEVKEWVCSVEIGELARLCGELEDGESPDEIRARIRPYLEQAIPDDPAVAEKLSAGL